MTDLDALSLPNHNVGIFRCLPNNGCTDIVWPRSGCGTRRYTATPFIAHVDIPSSFSYQNCPWYWGQILCQICTKHVRNCFVDVFGAPNSVMMFTSVNYELIWREYWVPRGKGGSRRRVEKTVWRATEMILLRVMIWGHVERMGEKIDQYRFR